MNNIRDFYELLDIPRTATESQIRSAYRKKALQRHPDKNPHNPNAAALFRELSEALQILTDPIAKKRYDTELLLNQLWQEPQQNKFREFQRQKLLRQCKILLRAFEYTCFCGVLVLVIYKLKVLKKVSENLGEPLLNPSSFPPFRIIPPSFLDRYKFCYIFPLLYPVEYPKGIVPAFSRYLSVTFIKKFFNQFFIKVF